MRFLRNLFAVILFAIVFLAVGFSLGYEGGSTLLSGDALREGANILFGGVGSLIALLGGLAVFIVLWWLVRRLAKRNHNDWAAVVAVIGAIIAAIIGLRFVNLDGRLWPLAFFLFAVLVETWLVTKTGLGSRVCGFYNRFRDSSGTRTAPPVVTTAGADD